MLLPGELGSIRVLFFFAGPFPSGSGFRALGLEGLRVLGLMSFGFALTV